MVWDLTIVGALGGALAGIVAYHWRQVRATRALLNEAGRALDQQHWDHATAVFRHALRIIDGMRIMRGDLAVLCLNGLATAHHRAKRQDEALRMALRALCALDFVEDVSPNGTETYQLVARILEAKGDVEEALRFRQFMAREDSGGEQEGAVAGNLAALGLALQTMGRHEDALDALDRAIQKSGAGTQPATREDKLRLAGANIHKGLSLARTGRGEEAEAHYRRAIELQTEAEGPTGLEVATGWAGLGVFFLDQKRPGEALEAFEQALAIRSRHPHATDLAVAQIKNNIAECLRQTGDLEQAERLAREAAHVQRAKGDPELHAALDTLGRAMLAQKRYEEAEKALAEASALLCAREGAGQDTICEYAQAHAEALEKLGRTDQARAVRARAVKLSLQPRRQDVEAILQDYARQLADQRTVTAMDWALRVGAVPLSGLLVVRAWESFLNGYEQLAILMVACAVWTTYKVWSQDQTRPPRFAELK